MPAPWLGSQGGDVSSGSRWEYHFDGVEVRLVPILAPLTCLSNTPSPRSKA